MDEKSQRLLKEAYRGVFPSGAFKRQLFQRLETKIEARRRPAGWRERVFAALLGPPDVTRGRSSRRTTSFLPNLALVTLLMLVVGSVALAIQGRLRPGDLPLIATIQTQVSQVFPEPLVPPTVTASPTVVGVQSVDEAPESPVVPAQEIPPAIQSPTASGPMVMETASDISTEIPEVPEVPVVVPSDTPVPTIVPTQVPVQTPSLPTYTPWPTPTYAPPSPPTDTPPSPLPPAPTDTPAPLPTHTPVPTSTPTSVPTPTQPVMPTATTCDASRIEGAAWVDVNRNGQRDAGDQPLSGVTVELRQGATASGPVVGRVTTGGDGKYRFNDLVAGLYYLQASPPAGHRAITAQSWGLDLICAPVTRDFVYQAEE